MLLNVSSGYNSKNPLRLKISLSIKRVQHTSAPAQHSSATRSVVSLFILRATWLAHNYGLQPALEEVSYAEVTYEVFLSPEKRPKFKI